MLLHLNDAHVTCKNAYKAKAILFFFFARSYVDRLCGLVVRVPAYTKEMYCASCEVRNEFMYVM
jgi:hypothetical protein